MDDDKKVEFIEKVSDLAKDMGIEHFCVAAADPMPFRSETVISSQARVRGNTEALTYMALRISNLCHGAVYGPPPNPEGN